MAELTAQLSTSITTASTLCAEIKKTRHIGHSHTQLDLLEASLASRPSALSSSSLSLSDDTNAELENYLSQMEEINGKLECIAHPNKHAHAHDHGGGLHHHHSRHEHKEMEDPHFGELR